MFPNTAPKKIFRNQQGFLIPLALFILVVMGVLALTISRTSMQTSASAIQEFTNIQAFYAAESGAQRGMKYLFFDLTQPPINKPITRANVDDQCSTLNTTYSYTADGLKACIAEVECKPQIDGDPAVAGDDIRSFYTIKSVGSCGVDQYRAVRTIQVGSFMMEQE